MQENNEIKALLHLIDDPDEEVYHTVSSKLISFGKAIIPNLENLWDNMQNETAQERIEQLIHRLHFRDLKDEFKEWLKIDSSLLSGALIIAKYHYPNIQPNIVLQEIEKLRRNIWLELNNYLTPMEKISVLNSIFYNYFKQTGVETSYDNPDHFLINKTLESNTGNSIGNGMVYLILCDLLDISVQSIHIPQQFILAYFDEHYDILSPTKAPSPKISFYIDPLSGQMYSNKDVESYFKKLSLTPTSSYFKPMSNKMVIKTLILELSKCFNDDNNNYKMEDLISLANLIPS